MTRQFLSGARILGVDGWIDHHSLVLEGPVIAAIVPDADIVADRTERLAGGYLIPGFIDIQVNGGGGILFNDDPTVEAIAAIGAAHRRFGTTGFLPTLISDSPDKVAKAIRAVSEAIAAGIPGVLGIHIEGPYLNVAKRGIHDASQIRSMDRAAIELLSSLDSGVSMVTIAPELAPPGAVAELARRGVVVMAGHSMANYDAIADAARAGVAGVTHLFNAMTQLEARSPGVVGGALDLGLYAGLIADGHHVHPASCRIAYRSLGPDRLLLVTDAMPTVGSSATAFQLGDTEIVYADGALRARDGTLAGSHLDMVQAVRNSMTMLGISLAEASTMASTTPASLLGMAHMRGTLAPGRAADLVHLNEGLDVAGCWIAGEIAEAGSGREATGAVGGIRAPSLPPAPPVRRPR